MICIDLLFFCPFHRCCCCCCGCPLSRCLTSWDNGNIGGERSHSRVGRYEMTQTFIKVACDLTKGDADRRRDVYSAVMSFADRNTGSMMKPLQTQISVAPATFLYSSSSSSSSCHREPWAQTLKQHTTPLYWRDSTGTNCKLVCVGVVLPSVSKNDLVVRWQPPTQIVAQTIQTECLFVLQGPRLRL